MNQIWFYINKISKYIEEEENNFKNTNAEYLSLKNKKNKILKIYSVFSKTTIGLMLISFFLNLFVHIFSINIMFEYIYLKGILTAILITTTILILITPILLKLLLRPVLKDMQLCLDNLFYNKRYNGLWYYDLKEISLLKEVDKNSLTIEKINEIYEIYQILNQNIKEIQS